MFYGLYFINNQGCILNLKFIFLPFLPPPFLIYIFSPTEFYYNEGVREAGEKFSAFFCNFVYFKSIGEKIFILFTNWGKNMHFPPFSPNLLFGHIFANRKIYTPVNNYEINMKKDISKTFILKLWTHDGRTAVQRVEAGPARLHHRAPAIRRQL